MRTKDTTDVINSTLAVLFDALAVFAGFMLATWIRFSSGWIAIEHAPPSNLYRQYAYAGLVITILYLFILRNQALFVRPQTGSFVNKIPRLVKSNSIGVVLSAVIAFSLQNEFDFSRIVIGIAWVTTTITLIIERYILFRIEWNLARHSHHHNRALIIGTHSVAAHLLRTLRREPMLRSNVHAFLSTDAEPPDPAIPPDMIKGTVADIERFVSSGEVDQVILADTSFGHARIMEIILLCERNLITFNMVPDLFRLMTVSMDVQSLDDIPLLGLRRWPLDLFWNRSLKRLVDIAGGLAGLLLSAPIIAVAAFAIRRASPGPVFYAQERCGEKGRPFRLYKLRTMIPDAEKQTGPVFATPDDTRRTPVGSFLRRYNLDELPQFWNVLKGDMSLVGPRPERPHFVEQFKNDFTGYMWRHVSKPGLTGWAQVNGLRGDTSIAERVKYDLYYLENWSMSFDFKILLKTLFTRENAY